MSNWEPVATAPEGKVVETKIDDGRGVRNVAMLKRQGRLWFMADGSMYVYYTPTHWRPAPLNPEKSGWWRDHDHYDRDGYCDSPARGY